MDSEYYNEAHDKARQVVLVYIDMTWPWVFLFDTTYSPKLMFSKWLYRQWT